MIEIINLMYIIGGYTVKGISNGLKPNLKLLLAIPLLLSWVFQSCTDGNSESRMSTNDVVRDLA